MSKEESEEPRKCCGAYCEEAGCCWGPEPPYKAEVEAGPFSPPGDNSED